MKRRKHVVPRRGLTRASVLLAFAAILVLLLAGASYAGYRYERSRSGQVLPGVRIAGVDVGGMTAAEAERALAPTVAQILGRPIEVRGAGHVWRMSAQGLGTRVDLQHAVALALDETRSYHWSARLYHRLLDRPIRRHIDLRVSHETSSVRRFVRDAAEKVKKAAQSAYLDVVDGELVTRRSRPGSELNARASRRRLMEAVRAGASSADLEVRRVKPKVSEASLGQTIIIRIGENRLYLYDGIKLAKSYPVATGQPGYPTPQGHWVIINKRVNPTWYNPAKDTWGKNEPDFIPPGPNNPLGTRALDLDAPGIRIHGTYADSSIGSYASHGCIRMHIPDSEDLFDRVAVGTPVIIAY